MCSENLHTTKIFTQLRNSFLPVEFSYHITAATSFRDRIIKLLEKMNKESKDDLRKPVQNTVHYSMFFKLQVEILWGHGGRGEINLVKPNTGIP